ncbi:uncharacterized protein LOC110055224 [Orbicella faveolata]|uniref:uncharacterized protein LOC110055224 n=1 Tax=Orbicella faveolata TaxID=48498 RepID=UPI0009E1F2AF|nr:uncharacterized protein LOC110055224 [Orbicella faveolata]XP_020617253.1 uncharacterized protein LOC110055224 [Orbicella faveolata]
MENCHHAEAKILSIIYSWYKAVDGRGLSEETQAQYCKDMMAWLLKDWMSYLDQHHDYSTIDMNRFCRPIKGICGMTREIIVGLVANLETHQQGREEYTKRDLPLEHPRASSTDDVEGIIALFHEVIDVVFDTKEFYDEFSKIMNEFSKKSDPSLSFYYLTGTQTHYRDFPLSSFNEPSKEAVERLDRVTLSR